MMLRFTALKVSYCQLEMIYKNLKIVTHFASILEIYTPKVIFVGEIHRCKLNCNFLN